MENFADYQVTCTKSLRFRLGFGNLVCLDIQCTGWRRGPVQSLSHPSLFAHQTFQSRLNSVPKLEPRAVSIRQQEWHPEWRIFSRYIQGMQTLHGKDFCKDKNHGCINVWLVVTGFDQEFFLFGAFNIKYFKS